MAIGMFVGWKENKAPTPNIDNYVDIKRELENKIKGLKMQNGRLKAKLKRVQEK